MHGHKLAVPFPSWKAGSTQPGHRGISHFVPSCYSLVKIRVVAHRKLHLFFLLSLLFPQTESRRLSFVLAETEECLSWRKKAFTNKQERTQGSIQGHVAWLASSYFSFTTLVSFIHCFSWGFSSDHMQMNSPQFTSPSRGRHEMAAVTCCALGLFPPVMFWWWENSLQFDMQCKVFLAVCALLQSTSKIISPDRLMVIWWPISAWKVQNLAPKVYSNNS